MSDYIVRATAADASIRAFAINAKTKDTTIAEAMHTNKDKTKLVSILFSLRFNFIIEKTSK